MVTHDPDALPEHARPGTVLQGKYRIDAVLGVGGMGAVVRAQHLVLDEPVAVKVLLPELAFNEEAAARFIREAKAALRIKSDHVVRVLDVDRLPDGTPYMAMELLDGADLDAVLDEHGPLDPASAVDAIIQACVALSEAHAEGIVHRDIKPANLFEVDDGRGGRAVKVLDFGISKLTDPSEQAMTKTATVMGSALYMSPEQLDSAKDVDARADIFALGVTLFQLLSGQLPFEGETMPQLVASVMAGKRQDLAELVPELPAELVAAVHRALATRRDDRQQSAAELAAALTPFASPRGAAIAQTLATASPVVDRSGGGAAARTEGAAAAATAGGGTSAPMATDPTVLAPPTSKARWPWVAAVAAVLIAIVVVLSFRSGEPGAQTPASAAPGEDEGASDAPGATGGADVTGAPGDNPSAGASPTATLPPPASAATAASASPSTSAATPPSTRPGTPPRQTGGSRPPPPPTATSTSKDYGGRK